MRIDKTKIFKLHCSKELTHKQFEMVSDIKSKYGIKSHQQKIIANFCEYNVEGDWVSRYGEVIEYIKEHGNKQTRESYMLKYGDVCGLAKYKRYCDSKKNTIENFIERYGYIEGNKRYTTFCNNNKGNKTKERFIEKYGEIEGIKRFNDCRLKDKSKGTLEYKIKKHGSDKGHYIFDTHMKALHHGASLQGYIDRYGEVEGRIRIREAKDNTSLQSFQKRYGYHDGECKYNEYIEKQRYNNTLDGFIERYGLEEGSIRYDKWLSTSCLGSCRDGVSPISQQLFDLIDSSTTSYYGKKNKEFACNHGNGSYFYDYVDTKTKKVIEFNGDIFHGNPSIFDAHDTPNPYARHLTCQDMWCEDEQKIGFIEDKGYNVLVVWEKDYRENKESIIKECKEFLYE